jgi:hypothetical protein
MSDIIDFRSDNLADVPAFFTGASSSSLVPSVFPVAIDGRPYMIDQKSRQFLRGFEPRIRDSVDQGVEPGEATINPQGLWRRNQTSWHFGAGQVYGDVDSDPYRFFKSKGVDPWSKGQLSLLNSTKLSLASANTNLPMVEVNGYVYVGDGQTLKYSNNPYAATPTWTSVTTGAPTATINDITTDGKQIYVAYANEGVMMTTIGGSSVTDHYATSGGTYNYTKLGFAKGFVLGFHNDTANSHIHIIPYVASTSHGSATATIRDPNFTCTGIVGGQNAIYVAGYSNDAGIVYRLGIKTDGTVDVAIVALELPTGEYPTSVHGYLGFIIVGTNKGVRFCSTDNDSNLVAGANIPTSGNVNGFTSEGRFVWFGYTNYDGVSSGLGRLDLSVFTSANTPAWATDLMYTSTASVKSCVTVESKRVFTISGVGVVVEDANTKVPSGNIETGKFRWGIMDPKFVVKVDARTTPLVGSITFYTSLDDKEYFENGISASALRTQHTFEGSETKMIEAAFKVVLTRSDSNGLSPTLTRITARAYATPTRSEYFKVPVLLHHRIDMWGRTYHFDVLAERAELRELVHNPRVIKYQEGNEVISVIVEDMEWQGEDARDREWEWDGTAIITMRSIEE